MRSGGGLRIALALIPQPKRTLPRALALTAVLAAFAAGEASAQGFGPQGHGSRFGAAARFNSSLPNSANRPTKIVRPGGLGPLAGGQGGYGGRGNPGKGGGKLTDGGPHPHGGGDPRPHLPRLPHGPIKPGGPIFVPGGPTVAADPGGPPPNGIVPLTSSGGGQGSSRSGNQAVSRGGSGAPPAGERRYVPDEVVVEVAANTSERAADALARRHRLARLETVDDRLTNTTLYRWRIPDRRAVPAVVRALAADRSVLSAQPNYLASLQQEATSPAPAGEIGFAQYAPAKLQLAQAHALAKGDKVLIAVIDSGVDLRHPELAGMIVESFDAVGFGDKVHSHGTAIAGAIVAHARLTGVAPAARILAARAFSGQRGGRGGKDGSTFSIVQAIDWAVAHDARIINMSFAGPRDPKIEENLAAAGKKGIVLVAAAGNDGPKSPPLYPAAYPFVIAVTATDEEDRLLSAANRGRHIAVAAAGVDLWLPAPNGDYQMTTGTSFAAAEVSGAVALLIERKPDLDSEAVRRVLMSTARDLGPKGFDPDFGAGLVDAYQAILSIAPQAAGTIGAGATAAAPGERE